jgi:1,4-dihydroxy-2-naphthoyl-CoA hydrolase
VESEARTAAEGDRLGARVGLEHLEDGPDGTARGRITVGEHLLQPHGFMHGGVFAVLAESICSRATMRAVGERGEIAMGQSNQTTFLRPVTEGSVEASARPLHRGRTTWVWHVEFTDDQGRLCAVSQMTVAVRPAR